MSKVGFTCIVHVVPNKADHIHDEMLAIRMHHNIMMPYFAVTELQFEIKSHREHN